MLSAGSSAYQSAFLTKNCICRFFRDWDCKASPPPCRRRCPRQGQAFLLLPWIVEHIVAKAFVHRNGRDGRARRDVGRDMRKRLILPAVRKRAVGAAPRDQAAAEERPHVRPAHFVEHQIPSREGAVAVRERLWDHRAPLAPIGLIVVVQARPALGKMQLQRGIRRALPLATSARANRRSQA